MSTNLTSTSWWKAALVRALRTAIAVAIPYAGASALFTGIPWLTVGSAAALGFVLSLLTSLVGISEATGTLVPVWYSVLEKVVKTVAQALVAGIGNAALFQNVHWTLIVQAALLAGLTTLLTSLLTVLPAVSAVAPTLPIEPTARPVVPLIGYVPLNGRLRVAHVAEHRADPGDPAARAS